MNEVEEKALEAFDDYLGSLASDAQTILDAVGDESLSEDCRQILAGSLNYLFKSLDLIDDGIEGLGYLDDAFVLRLSCLKAAQSGPLPESLQSLTSEAELVIAFIGDLVGRFDQYLSQQVSSTVRGRSVAEIVGNQEVLKELAFDVASWADTYSKPHFVLDERGLVKLLAFLGAKLPY